MQGRQPLHLDQEVDLHLNGRVYTSTQVSTAFGKAADELPALAAESADVGHVSDAMVVVGLYFLEHPEATVEEAIASNPQYNGMSLQEALGA